jgi:hypothetical protein
MRCESCARFVSYGERDPEVEEVSVEAADGGGTLTGTALVVLECAECGSDLKSASLDFSADFAHECPGGVRECETCLGEGEVDCPGCEGVGTLESDTGEECPTCMGTGYLGPDGMSAVAEDEGAEMCDECRGRGRVSSEDEPCPDCGGTGRGDCPDCEGGEVATAEPADGEEWYECDEGDVEATFTTRVQTAYLDKKGVLKPAPARKWRTFYGAEIQATVKCLVCEEEITVEASVDEQASAFDEA